MICINGVLIDSAIDHNLLLNRGFLYGDGFFESMRFKYGSVYFFDDHYDRFIHTAELLCMDTKTLPTKEKLLKTIQEFATKNNCKEHARIRVNVFRDSSGLYAPNENSVAYIMMMHKLDTDYVFNEVGLDTGIYQTQTKAPGIYSNIKSLSAQFYVMAGLDAKARGKDELIVLNTNGNCIEGFTSNLFMLKDNCIYTPFLSEGCIDGIFRRQLQKIAFKLNLDYQEKIISILDLQMADEVWLTNAIKGIQPVRKLNNKTYNIDVARKAFQEINRI
jgi:branched-chain amino acid aminotransferase